jgi:hypothetical protein
MDNERNEVIRTLNAIPSSQKNPGQNLGSRAPSDKGGDNWSMVSWKFTLTCYYCTIVDHMARDCYKKVRDLKTGNTKVGKSRGPGVFGRDNPEENQREPSLEGVGSWIKHDSPEQHNRLPLFWNQTFKLTLEPYPPDYLPKKVTLIETGTFHPYQNFFTAKNLTQITRKLPNIRSVYAAHNQPTSARTKYKCKQVRQILPSPNGCTTMIPRKWSIQN